MFLSVFTVLLAASSALSAPQAEGSGTFIEEDLFTTQLPDLQPLILMHRDPVNGSHVPVPGLLEDITDENENEGSGSEEVDPQPGEGYAQRPDRNRIVGGGEVSPKYKLGYQAMVQPCHIAKNECYLCGGTVVHQRYVITAAHCLYTQDGTRMTPSNTRFNVVVGEHNVCDGVGAGSSEGGQILRASEVFEHPNYGNNDNDMAILKLPQDIIFNNQVRLACLPTSPTADYSGQSVTVSGWGGIRGYNGGQQSPQQPRQCRLKETTVQVKAYSDIECRRLLRSEDSSRLCAYAPRTDTCQGDSGGPLTLKQGDRYVLLGVTSYGYGCADSRGVAGIYARVQGFLPWIAGIIPGTVACGTATAATSAPNAGVSGTVQSPGYPTNYPNNEDKTSTIIAAEGKVIQVTFQKVDIEFHRTCRYDYVMARDGDGTVLMQKTCGSRKTPPAAFTSQTNKVEIIFHSDRSVNRKGFQLSWKEVAKQASGILTSPNSPSNYPDNVHKTYPLEAGPGKRIKMLFLHFGVEAASYCRYDYLKVTDGDGSVLMDKTCGDNEPATLTSNTASVSVLFHTDGSVTGKGFMIIWTYI